MHINAYLNKIHTYILTYEYINIYSYVKKNKTNFKIYYKCSKY